MSNETGLDQGESLTALFFDFVNKVLAQAESFVAAEQMPTSVEWQFEFKAPEFSGSAAVGSTMSFRQVQKPDFRGLILFNRERWATAEAERCAREHFEHGVTRPRQVLGDDWQPIALPTFGASGNQLGRQLAYEVYYALADLCERHQNLRFTREELLEAYKRLREEWTSPTVTWRLAAPLINFKSEKYPVQIGRNLELVALTHEEKTDLWNHNAAFGPFGEASVIDRGDFARAQFVLRGSSSSERDDHGFGPKFRNEAMKIVTALRLFGSGEVGIPAILGTSTGLSQKFAPQYLFDGRARNSGRMYELRAADWDGFMGVYDAVGAIEGKMDIPLRRFNQAYSRQSTEDAVIDLTIALESCLLPDTKRKKVPLSKRGAALLIGLSNPVETEALLKTEYGIRSEIVHNGKLLSDQEVRKKVERLGPVVARDFLHACEDVTRDVLRECVLRLAAGGSFVDLCRELDERVLSGPTRTRRTS
jgi:hypothetical protein